MKANPDDLLQEKLEKLEAGATMDNVFASLAGEDENLIEDLKTAKLLLEHRHPLPSESAVASGREQLLSLSRHTKSSGSNRSNGKNRTNWLVPVFAVTSVMAIFMCTVLIGFGIWTNNHLKSNSVALLSLSGIVETTQTGKPDQWQALQSGARIRAGEQIKTSANASALLEFADGSRTLVGPSTQIIFDEIQSRAGGTITVKMTQLNGSTSHRVVPFGDKASVYNVLTPSGSASVKGTEFAVNVDQSGATALSVDKGSVLVHGSNTEVFVEAGQKTTLHVGEDPEQPAYQFAIQGLLSDKSEGLWVISGKPIQIDASTIIIGNPEVGDKVFVEGRILSDGTWLADQILMVTSDSISSYTGVVQQIGETIWVVSGQEILVSEGTLISGDINLNTPVKVLFLTQDDGSWLALSIVSLEESGEEPEPTNTPEATFTPDPNAMPSLAFIPDEIIITNACENHAAVQGTLVNSSSDPKDIARGVQLGYEVVSGADWVDQILVVPSSWDQIAAGESVSFSVKVLFKTDWQAAQPGSEVNIRVYIAAEINRPDDLNGSVSVTFVRNCDTTTEPTETPTPEFTLTPTPIKEFTPTPTLLPSPTPDQITDCTGANPHPHGTTLALRYGVPYEEIMGWFCQNFGFGEIDLAYGLSLQSGTPVTEIFDMRKAGMGWGEIKKLLVPKDNGGPPGGPPDKKPKPTKKK